MEYKEVSRRLQAWCSKRRKQVNNGQNIEEVRYGCDNQSERPLPEQGVNNDETEVFWSTKRLSQQARDIVYEESPTCSKPPIKRLCGVSRLAMLPEAKFAAWCMHSASIHLLTALPGVPRIPVIFLIIDLHALP
jgi:hypothetical protein